jgi:hypothetical protein
MRVVAVRTGYASGVHFALGERGMIEHFVALLAIGVEETGLEH